MDCSLTFELASRFAATALENLAQEYPHKLDHVLTGDGDAVPARALHPSFHASYDWHSCVHMHWLLVHVRRRFPDLPQRAAIEDVLSRHFSPDAIAGECAYLERPHAGSFERPYGWAWLLELARELRACDDASAAAWTNALVPLTGAIEARFLTYLPRADYATRYGMHANSAFALLLAIDYSRAASRDELSRACIAKARQWYVHDRDGPAQWEPSGADFLSPTLIEAALMTRVLDADAFAAWLERFLPRLRERLPATLFAPVRVSDRADAQIVHLDGLNLSRAWCFHEIAAALVADEPRRALLRDAAHEHLRAGMAALDARAFVATHWLASFAALALRVAND